MLDAGCWYSVWKYMELLSIKDEKDNENDRHDYEIYFQTSVKS